MSGALFGQWVKIFAFLKTRMRAHRWPAQNKICFARDRSVCCNSVLLALGGLRANEATLRRRSKKSELRSFGKNNFSIKSDRMMEGRSYCGAEEKGDAFSLQHESRRASGPSVNFKDLRRILTNSWV